MTARTEAAPRSVALTALWALLLLESLLGLVVAILLSLVAGEVGGSAEESTRFGAAGAFLFAIAAFVAALGVRRRSGWSWTLGALLQLLLAISAGIAMFAAGEGGPTIGFLVAFALAGITMLALSGSQVRRALGKE